MRLCRIQVLFNFFRSNVGHGDIFCAVFRDKFTAAGINQTKHQILLDVDVRVSILLPGITTYTKVSNEISVAETVIVGGVPQTYTYFSTTEDKIEDYADEYIMNNG